ncbi:MAG: cysteine desulfurase [Symbiobacteriia bacterium]
MNVAEIRKDFPILSQEVGGHPLVYLDNAATTQKPRQVIEALVRYYETSNANVHRGVHTLAERATEQYESARDKVVRFINAPSRRNVVFTRNASEAINMVAYSWGHKFIKEGDEIVVTPMEHHSNLVPWQQVALHTGAKLRFIEMLPNGLLRTDNLDQIITAKTKLVAVTQASNVLGTINPVTGIVRLAHQVGAKVMVDGAQSVPHLPVDVQGLDIDWLAFSGHKMLGPTGIGVLYGREELLEAMDPFLFGGEMISRVYLTCAEWTELPHRFEAGTPNIAGAIGLGAAIDYLSAIGMKNVYEHEQRLTRYAIDKLETIDGFRLYGPHEPRGGLVAFNLGDIHAHDVATVLDSYGVAVRAGHHCAQPLANWLDVVATNRASFYIYNTESEIDALTEALIRTKEFFSHVA